MLARKLISFNSLFRPYFGTFWCSSTIYNNLFKSNYHLKGPKRFSKYKEAALLNEEALTLKIIQATDKLDPLRQKIIKSYPKKTPSFQDKNPMVMQYAKEYSELLSIVEESQLNNMWVWNIISWYNLTSMYAELYWQLITTTSIKQMRQLITCLSMMNLEPGGEMDEILQEVYETTNYQQFYKSLFHNLELEYLRLLDGIMKGPRTFSKRKYYEWYLRNHLQGILKCTDPNNEQELSNLIWLFQASVKQLCDDEILIGKIEKYLLTTRVPLKDESIERLINLYKIKGKINNVVFNTYIKKYILNNKMKTFDDAIDAFQFYIYSQVYDEELLTNIYYKLTKIDSMSEISAQSAQKLHILSHFQKIVNNELKLTDTLTSELDNMCANKKFHENQNHLDSLVLKQLDKQANEGKFISKCLMQRPQQLTLISQQEIDIVESTNILKNIPTNLRDSNTYGNNKFCCFELEYVMQSKITTDVVVFQLSSIDNILNSGRLVREMSVRDKILKYYGIRIHYPNLHNIKTKGKLTVEDFMISKKYSIGKI